ncbi:DUF6716 putative glycosyltransferase [Myceligenerans indicum]|uniref:Uncharacterized protein n=1 Tax=Myceligenerans indicum TaxID=2593663 RepID=A0ABS1LI14_9MICO|nr:DUF6716 putative glycosyltransferase [Myceligenerans indicum]MBL0885861.1 hypothetical protein [Myceligenerans indicum]
MTADQRPRVLAVADSDSYLKWAATTLVALGDTAGSTDVVVVRSPIKPTPGQAEAAVAGTGLPVPPVLGLPGLWRKLRRERPDVLLLAATGPTAEVVARLAVRALGRERPVFVSGLPGMGLPATEHGTGWRRWCDIFITHGRREVEAYRDAFAGHDVTPELVLTRLPFLPGGPSGAGSGAAREQLTDPVKRLVFAAQPSVPDEREERLLLLDRLARLSEAGLDVVVKLRARAGERQTHNEAYPYDSLWEANAAGLGHAADTLTFADGPMSAQLIPGTALVTVSSTAALESLAAGLPTVLVGDLGVREDLLNEPFAASGCMVRLDELVGVLNDGGPHADHEWLEQNYLHAAPSNLPEAIQNLAGLRAEGGLAPLDDVVPWSSRRHRWSLLRLTVPRPIALAVAGVRRRLLPGG